MIMDAKDTRSKANYDKGEHELYRLKEDVDHTSFPNSIAMDGPWRMTSATQV